MTETEKRAAEEIVELQKELIELKKELDLAEKQSTELSIVATVVTCLMLIGYFAARILV